MGGLWLPPLAELCRPSGPGLRWLSPSSRCAEPRASRGIFSPGGGEPGTVTARGLARPCPDVSLLPAASDSTLAASQASALPAAAGGLSADQEPEADQSLELAEKGTGAGRFPGAFRRSGVTSPPWETGSDPGPAAPRPVAHDKLFYPDS